MDDIAILPLPRREAPEVVQRSALFAALPPDVLDDVIAHLHLLSFAARDVVVREGDEADRYYVIASGEAEVWEQKGLRAHPTRPSGDDAWVPDSRRQMLLARLGVGDGFGEMALLLGGTRRATVQAVTPLVVYAIDRATFADLLSKHRGLSLAMEQTVLLRGVAAFLGKTSPFGNIPAELLGRLAAGMFPMQFEAGDEIVRAGAPANSMYIIRSGQAEVVVPGADGSERRIATLGPGDPFGEQALAANEPRSATVRAIEPVEALRLTRSHFEEIVHEHAGLADYFRRLALQRQRPRRIADWTMERQTSGDGNAVVILADARTHRYLKLSEEAAFLWELMDGQHTVRDLAQAYFTRFGRFGLDSVIDAMLQLDAAEFVAIQHVESLGRAEAPVPSRWRRGMALLHGLVIHQVALPDIDRPLTFLSRRLLWPLYTLPAQILLLAIAVVGVTAFVRIIVHGGSAVSPTWGRWAAVVVPCGIVLQLLLHELAHAVTCKQFGRKVHRAGVGWYLFMPIAFVDTSDIWMSGRWPRIAVSLAGPYTNVLVSGVAILLLPVAARFGLQGALFEVASTGYALALYNANPLVEFDGYYVLMDWLDVPNLRAKALAFLGALLWRRALPTRDRRLRLLFVGYGVLALCYTVVVARMVLTGYQRFAQGLIVRIVPMGVATVIGWAIALGMVYLIAAGAWRALRPGAARR